MRRIGNTKGRGDGGRRRYGKKVTGKGGQERNLRGRSGRKVEKGGGKEVGTRER